MRLRQGQLAAALGKELAPVYFITGDEPLQLGEAADAVRLAARNKGYAGREVFSAETGFNWSELTASAGAMSIFSERKILDLRIPSGKPGKEGAKAIMDYCARLPEDTLLLITAGKLAGTALKSRWFQTLDKLGVVIQVWPLQGRDLIQWLQQRMQSKGLQVDQEGLKILASRIEGNLLAAAQEIEKLYILFGVGKLTTQQIMSAVADSSRYDVFNLTDSLLAAQLNRAVKILQGLQAEAIAAPVVLWAITREARMLLAIKQTANKDSAFRKYQVWDKRKRLVNAALDRLTVKELEQVLLLSAEVDRQIKGEQTGDPWETLLAVCMRFCSVKIL
jgi:DNA polymerase III subunit delta